MILVLEPQNNFKIISRSVRKIATPKRFVPKGGHGLKGLIDNQSF